MNPWVWQDVALLSPGWLVAVLACLVLAWRGPRPPPGHGWQRIMSPPVLAFLTGTARRGAAARRRFDPVWLLAALVALTLSAPATRRTDASTWRHASGWIAIVDVSRSMTLDDVVPSRLAAARDALLALSRAAGARPLGLVIYAGDAFLVSPPAFDHALFDTYVRLLEHGSVPVEGSNTARALSLAGSVVTEAHLLSARLFLLGDGGGANRAAHAAARFSAAGGHRLDVLQFGRPDNAAGPGGRVEVAALERLADSGGGELVMADALGHIDPDSLDLASDAADVEGLRAVVWHNRSHWLLLAGLPLLLVQARRWHAPETSRAQAPETSRARVSETDRTRP